MKKFRHIILGFFSLCVFSLSAQDIHFSQFYLSPLNLNPALTGVMNCNIRFTANYRNQWGSILGANSFRTYSFSYDQRIPVGRHDFFGVGGTFWGDKAGTSEFAALTAKLSGSYSKRVGGFRKKSHYLVVGAEGGIAQRSISFINLRWGRQHDNNGGFDPSIDPGEEGFEPNFLFADMAAGLLWFSNFDEDNNLYFGGSFHHLNRADQSFRESEVDELFSRFSFHGGGEFMLTDRFGLVPGIIAMVQGPSFQLNTGTSIKLLFAGNRRNYQALQLGVWTRLSNKLETGILNDAVIISTRFDYNNFTLGFSYDINVSELSAGTNGNGGFEFALAYKICNLNRKGVYCPRF